MFCKSQERNREIARFKCINLAREYHNFHFFAISFLQEEAILFFSYLIIDTKDEEIKIGSDMFAVHIELNIYTNEI